MKLDYLENFFLEILSLKQDKILNISEIENLINNNKFPYPIVTLEKKDNVIIYRARPHLEGEENIDFKKIEHLHHKTDCEKINIGRCNIKGMPIFYGATHIDISLNEVYNEKVVKNRNLITIGHWKLKEDLQLLFPPPKQSIIDNELLSDLEKEYIIESDSFFYSLEKNNNDNTFYLRSILNFFSSEFESTQSNYAFTAAFASVYLNSKGTRIKSNIKLKNIIPKGIVYRSTKCKEKGMNLALTPSTIEQRYLELIKVEKYESLGNDDFSLIKSTDKIDYINGEILW